MTPVGPPAILCVGRLYCDFIFTEVPRLPTLGTEVYAGGFGAHAGGGAFITAAHLAALGHSTSLATHLPASPFMEHIREELQTARLDLSLSRTLPQTAGPQLTVAMVHSSDRAFLTRRTGPAIPPLNPNDLTYRKLRHLHIGELASLVECPEVVTMARKLGMTISLDCSWDDALCVTDIRPLLGSVDVFLPNENEVAHLKCIGLAEAFAPLTVVKRGASGATAMTATQVVDAPTEPLQAVDSTGAGDAFNAGFLSAWLSGNTLEACLRAGNTRGALALQSRGGFHPDMRSPSGFKQLHE